MARHRKHRKGGKKKIPILATAGVVGTGMYIANAYQTGGTAKALHAMTGMSADGSFNLHDAMVTYTPVIVGVVGSAIASKSHVNRYMSRVPMFNL